MQWAPRAVPRRSRRRENCFPSVHLWRAGRTCGPRVAGRRGRCARLMPSGGDWANALAVQPVSSSSRLGRSAHRACPRDPYGSSRPSVGRQQGARPFAIAKAAGLGSKPQPEGGLEGLGAELRRIIAGGSPAMRKCALLSFDRAGYPLGTNATPFHLTRIGSLGVQLVVDLAQRAAAEWEELVETVFQNF